MGFLALHICDGFGLEGQTKTYGDRRRQLSSLSLKAFEGSALNHISLLPGWVHFIWPEGGAERAVNAADDHIFSQHTQQQA